MSQRKQIKPKMKSRFRLIFFALSPPAPDLWHSFLPLHSRKNVCMRDWRRETGGKRQAPKYWSGSVNDRSSSRRRQPLVSRRKRERRDPAITSSPFLLDYFRSRELSLHSLCFCSSASPVDVVSAAAAAVGAVPHQRRVSRREKRVSEQRRQQHHEEERKTIAYSSAHAHCI